MQMDKWAVRRLMAERGIESQKDLADLVGVSQNTVSALLKGAFFSSGTLAGLCRALHCTPNDIFTGYPEEVRAPVSMA